jgi:hypothetical protein
MNRLNFITFFYGFRFTTVLPNFIQNGSREMALQVRDNRILDFISGSIKLNQYLLCGNHHGFNYFLGGSVVPWMITLAIQFFDATCVQVRFLLVLKVEKATGKVKRAPSTHIRVFKSRWVDIF